MYLHLRPSYGYSRDNKLEFQKKKKKALSRPCPGLFSSPHDPAHLHHLPRQVLIANLMDPDIELAAQIPREDGYIVQDYNDSANPLWSLYGKIAKEDDKAALDDVTDDMNSLLLFMRLLSFTLPALRRIHGWAHAKAGLSSAVLTAFIIDRNQAIQPTPAQQSAFYQQQSVALLNQISQQLSSLGAQIPVPSGDSSLSGFTLSPSASDVQVNIIWIISLMFSLTAALLATLIRQRARDHMSIFQRYIDPLMVARIRHYLFEDSGDKYIPVLAEVVPGLVHISLLLFFAWLADFLLNIYTTVGRSTLFAIAICPTLYIIITVAPVIDPQSSYRTPYSSLVWYIARILKIQPGGGMFGFTVLMRLGTPLEVRRTCHMALSVR